jgi:hypothetical protein
MKNTGLKNEELLNDLQIDGSSAVKPRNDYGVYLFDEKETKDGVIFSKLSKPKYIEDELLKSIDTDIVELLPITASELPPTILLELYNEVTASLSSSLADNEKLKDDILALTASLSELKSELEELEIINDSLNLNTAIAENSLQVVNSRLELTIENLQNAINRATDESILRASLTAEVELLTQINKGLETQIDQLQTQLSTLIGLGIEPRSAEEEKENDVNKGRFIVAPVSRTNLSERPIHATQKFKRDFFSRFSSNRDIIFVNGPKIRIQNLSALNPVTIRITKSTAGGSVDWFRIPTSITLGAGEIRTIELTSIKDWSESRDDPKTFTGRITFNSANFIQTLDTSIKRNKK